MPLPISHFSPPIVSIYKLKNYSHAQSVVSYCAGQLLHCRHHGSGAAVCFCGRTQLAEVPVFSARTLPCGHAGLGVSGPLRLIDGRFPVGRAAALGLLPEHFPGEPGCCHWHAHLLPDTRLCPLAYRVFYAARPGVLLFHLALLERYPGAERFTGVICKGGSAVHAVLHTGPLGDASYHSPGLAAEGHLLHDSAILPALSVQRLVHFCRAGPVFSASGKPACFGLWTYRWESGKAEASLCYSFLAHFRLPTSHFRL